jgi:hypothetical protein
MDTSMPFFCVCLSLTHSVSSSNTVLYIDYTVPYYILYSPTGTYIRAKRIARNRQAGNLLEFSPPGRQSKSKRTKKAPGAYDNNTYMLDLSPSGGSSLGEDDDDIDNDTNSCLMHDIKASNSHSHPTSASSCSSSRGSGSGGGSIQLTKEQMRHIASGDESFRVMEQELFEAKEELAKVEAKLEDSEQDAAALQHRIAEVEHDLKATQKEQHYLVAEQEQTARAQEERFETELAKQRDMMIISAASKEEDTDTHQHQTTMKISELETELHQMNQQYTHAQQEVLSLEAKLLQKDTECAGIKDSMQQRLDERDDQLHKERDERKIDKQESTAVRVCSWVFFMLCMFLPHVRFGRHGRSPSHSFPFFLYFQKETTIRQLSSVLEAAKEKERALETSLKSLQVQIGEAQSKASQHSNDEISAMQLEHKKSDAAVAAMARELASLKERLAIKEESLVELKRTLEQERASFHQQTQDLEHKLLSHQNETRALKESNSGLEQKVDSMHKAMQEMKATLATSEREQKILMEKLSRSNKQSEAHDSRTHTLQEKLATEQDLRKADKEKLDQMDQNLSKAQSSLDHLNKELQATHRQLQDTAIQRDQNSNRLVTFDAREEELLKKLRVMDDIRRTLHNRVIQLSGNIRVFVRVRPIIPCEMDAVAVAPKTTSAHAPASATKQRPHSAACGGGGGDAPRGIKRKQPMDANADECPFEFPGVADRSEESALSSAQQQQHQHVDGTSEDLTKQVIMATEPFKDRGGLKPRRKTWKFGFDHVFSPQQDQLDVWMATEPMVQSVIDGFNVCIFAYGMTGAGKTHTMLGSHQDPKQQGLIYRSVSKLFQAKRDLEAGTGGLLVDMSVELLEIYNENIRDLLSLKKVDPTTGGGLRIQSNESVGNVVATADSEEDVLTILDLAQSRRCVKATNSNAESSRSHMIFTIHFDVLSRKHKHNAPVRSGKLHICDLAGSERLGKSGSHGNLLKETQAINKSLMNLSNVIEKLQAGDAHIPYRDSKLTHLLQNSLGGDSKTLCVVCCNPLPEHFNESLCSLRFASKVSRVELKALSKVNV